MGCSNHPDIEGIGTCISCGKEFCSECAVELEGRVWCRKCLARVLKESGAGQVHPRWKKLAAALLSIVPGAGHMFLGLIGKGFAIMGLLFAAVFLVILYSDATGMYWMTAYLIPTLGVLFLSYAVFDSMSIADARRRGVEHSPADDDLMKAVWERVLLNRATGGVILVIGGAVGLLHIFESPLTAFMRQVLGVELPATALVLPIALLAVGIWLLRKGARQRK